MSKGKFLFFRAFAEFAYKNFNNRKITLKKEKCIKIFQNAAMDLRKGKVNPIYMINKKQKFYAQT